MSKEERLAMVKAGREDRGPYMARAAVKQKKVSFLAVGVYVLWW
jgi:protein SDA1